MTILAAIGIAVRSRESNPWLDRLLASLQRHPCGVPRTDVLVEEGELLTKVEKLNRLLRAADARYVALLEDDAEVLHPGWLTGMLLSMQAVGGVALAGPLEADPSVVEERAVEALQPGVEEISNLPGFCLLVDKDAGLTFDVRCQTMSDLYLSLLARSWGFRMVRAHSAILRHTKEPWARDAVPPWTQDDRSRYGAGDAYYAQQAHQAKRVREARFLIEQFGDLARQTLPKELLVLVEPDAGGWTDLQPGCWQCRRQFPLGSEWVMTANGPQCFACRFGEDFVGTLHVSPEAVAALAEDG